MLHDYAFLLCLNFTLGSYYNYVLEPYEQQSGLSLPLLVHQGYSALFVSILSDESKELFTLMKARGYSSDKASCLISIRIS